MFGRSPLKDAKRAGRAVLTNQLARVAPGFYMRLVGETGRGLAPETPPQTAEYFRECLRDYLSVLGGVSLTGKHILEYGPGDVPAMALLLIAHGARKVYCADRFSLLALSPVNIAVLRELLNGMASEERRLAGACFHIAGKPESGLNPDRIEYLVKRSGLSGLSEEVDIVLSRAVLEHVDSLDATFVDMERALRKGGIAAHQVDLKSHGLHRENPLDFLTWPEWLWRSMYGAKGAPNRWRIDRYREVLTRTRLSVRLLEPRERAEKADIDHVRPYLARSFRDLPDEDLAWLGFWLVCEKV